MADKLLDLSLCREKRMGSLGCKRQEKVGRGEKEKRDSVASLVTDMAFHLNKKEE